MKRDLDIAWAFWLLLGLPLVFVLAGVPLRLLLEGSGGVFASESAIAAIRVSVWTSLVAVGLSALFGLPLAWSLARGRFPLKRVLESLIELPVVLPPAAAGIGLLMLFGHQGAIGRWLEDIGHPVVFTPFAVVLAQLFVASPLFVRSASSALSTIDRDLEHCAHLDGASRLAMIWHISLPLARKGLLGGILLCWARAIGEFGATILFAGNFEGRTQTMPLAIYAGFEQDLSGALGLSRGLLLIAVAVLLVAKLLDR